MLPSPSISLWRKLVYLTVVGVGLLGLAEGALRLRAWLKYGSTTPAVRDAMLVRDEGAGLWVPRPGYEVRGANIHIRINSAGFRGPEFAMKKPAGTFRIVCLGASTTFSAEASSNEAIWTYRLQQKLQAAYPDVPIEVLNPAVGGYVSDDNVKNLRHRVLPVEPDLVLYYEANNEIVRDTRELAIRQGADIHDGRQQPAWAAALSRASLFFDLAYKNLAILVRSRETGRQRINQIPDDLPDRFIGNLNLMRQMLADEGVPFLLSTFIVKYRKGQPRSTQIANADVAFYYMPWMSIDGMLNAVDTYNNAIVAFGRRAGVPVIDDRNAVPADAGHFVDCMHLTDAGNDAMADRFAKALRPDGPLDVRRLRRAAAVSAETARAGAEDTAARTGRRPAAR